MILICFNVMTQYDSFNVKLSSSQLKICNKIGTGVTLNL